MGPSRDSLTQGKTLFYELLLLALRKLTRRTQLTSVLTQPQCPLLLQKCLSLKRAVPRVALQLGSNKALGPLLLQQLRHHVLSARGWTGGFLPPRSPFASFSFPLPHALVTKYTFYDTQPCDRGNSRAPLVQHSPSASAPLSLPPPSPGAAPQPALWLLKEFLKSFWQLLGKTKAREKTKQKQKTNKTKNPCILFCYSVRTKCNRPSKMSEIYLNHASTFQSIILQHE